MKMSGDEMGLVPPQTRLNSQLLFQDDPLRFNSPAPQNRGVGDPVPKAREIPSSFLETRYFPPPPPHPQPSEFRHNPYANDSRPDAGAPPNWSDNNDSSADGSEGNDEDDDDDDDVDEEEEAAFVGFVGEPNRAQNDANSNKDSCGNNNKSNSSGRVVKLTNGKTKFGPSFGSGREVVVVTDGNCGRAASDTRGSCGEIHQQRVRTGNFENAVTIAEPDGELYYSQYLQGEGSGRGQKDVVAVDSGCGFSGRKDGLLSSDSGESLRDIFSDPLTGALMDDAMILPCGHSFGGGGIQHVIRMKACPSCQLSISEDSILPNLSLQAAIQAFLREEDLLFHRSSKRRRERFDQEKGNCSDSNLMDTTRGRGVQFPFAVTDRVIIKGNKRTPERFVGREAVVTTQCLNGWYVVKTLDNAESVKLQYRSLAKVPDEASSKALSCKQTTNWL
ncbi:U-box domain-containing protein 62 [Rhodamnia argentea]|uniref:U-box domain-containing protein 62 n=1 Tax=Rhodamnia argentea TaxID=178133 RepID=A0A8B8Q051_9MYRT|nr:U-box domain-containing protein 62 [Rhodamnia argentea]